MRNNVILKNHIEYNTIYIWKNHESSQIIYRVNIQNILEFMMIKYIIRYIVLSIKYIMTQLTTFKLYILKTMYVE